MAVKSKQMPQKLALSLLATVFFMSGCIAQSDGIDKLESESAVEASEKKLRVAEKKSDSTHFSAESTPKNIIVFIGDGMGISTITAGRI